MLSAEALPLVIAVLFGCALFALELSLRKRAGIQPSSFKAFVEWGQKRKSPDPKYSALIFSMMAIFCFQVWEAFVRFLFQQTPQWPLVIVGAAVLLFLFIRRARPVTVGGPSALKPLGLYWLLSAFVAFSVLLQAWGMMVALPWLLYRARFLSKSF